MTTYTLDTNLIIDLELDRAEYRELRELISLVGHENVAVSAVSASERQPGDTYLDRYEDFQKKVENAGLGDCPEVLGTMYWNMCCFGRSIWSSKELLELEERIHLALFPNIPFVLDDATSKGVTYKRWRNAFCDRQMLLSHMNAERDVFLTRDRNFGDRLAGRSWAPPIMTPSEALRKRP